MTLKILFENPTIFDVPKILIWRFQNPPIPDILKIQKSLFKIPKTSPKYFKIAKQTNNF